MSHWHPHSSVSKYNLAVWQLVWPRLILTGHFLFRVAETRVNEVRLIIRQLVPVFRLQPFNHRFALGAAQVCRRPPIDHAISKLFCATGRRIRLFVLQLIQSTNCCLISMGLELNHYRVNARRTKFSSILTSKVRDLFSAVLTRTPGGVLPGTKSTIHVVTLRFLPFLPLFRSPVSTTPDKYRQRFLSSSSNINEALKAARPLRPHRRNVFGKLPLNLLDRNHFLVLVNGRSPP